MVRHILTIFQHLLEDFWSVHDHFGALKIKGLKIFLFILEIQLQMKHDIFRFEYIIHKYVAEDLKSQKSVSWKREWSAKSEHNQRFFSRNTFHIGNIVNNNALFEKYTPLKIKRKV